MPEELTAEQVRRTCDPAALGFQSTREVAPISQIVGQPRAVEALEFGLTIRQMGYNIYVAGPPGIGKTTAVTKFLEDRARKEPTPPDVCYVHNFSDPYRPAVLRLPPGKGRELQHSLRTVIQRIQQELRQAFESEEYSNRRDATLQAAQKERDDLIYQINQEAQQEGFAIQATPVGLFVLPMIQGQPVSDQQLASLAPEQREEIRRRKEALEGRLRDSMKRIRQLQKNAQERIEALNREVAQYVVGGLLDDVYEAFEPYGDVIHYLRQLQDDIISNLEPLLAQPSDQAGAEWSPAAWARQAALRKYEVNLLVDHGDNNGAPVVYELNPSYPNLFGRIEKEALFGTLQADFTLIRAGALHRANGGYLVLSAEELLRSPFSYDTIKRALRSREATVEDITERLGLVVTKSLQPQPVPLDVKVILIGNSYLYYLLYALDPDFPELFKIKADFDTRMDRTEENVRNYAAFVCTLCEKEGLRPMDASAVAKVVEQGSRLAENQEKLSSRFLDVANIVREADTWAAREGAEQITAAHINQAVEHRIYRSNLIQQRIQEMIARDVLRVETSGKAVGQANGLVVIPLGDYTFGRPSRVTATIGLGQQGVVDIEREAKLGGPIHTKGVLILGGYLSERYATDKPLTLAARLVFEQSYEGVEGDSASSTELYALLSALSGLPIKQSLAITGSVDQHGNVQALGGVNEKIEGFYDVCQARGLSGDQGVLIPRSNVQNLMLREDIVEAVRQGKFHIYPVDTIDQGISLLTGVPAGERQPDGSYPEGTVNYLVDKRLRQMAERMRSFGRQAPEEQKGQEQAPEEGNQRKES